MSYNSIHFFNKFKELFMKKFILQSFTVSVLSLVGNNAFAQENIEIEENNVSFYGVVQFNANTSDSQRPNIPDFSASKLQIGTNIKGGIVSGGIEVQINGNNSSKQAVVLNPPAKADPNNPEAPLPPQTGETAGDNGNDSISIRKAQVDLDALIFKAGSNTYTTTVSLGGIRLNGADGTAPDIAWTTQGFARQDGIYLKEAMDFNKQGSFELGIGAFNNIFAFGNAAYPTGGGLGYVGWGNQNAVTIPANWMKPSFNQSIGLAGHIAGSYNFDDNQSLTARAYFGSQSNAPGKQNAFGALQTVRDVTHIEASLLYINSSIFGKDGVISTNGVSVWYENEEIGNNKKNLGVNDSQNTTLIGVGVAADSKNYLTNMLQKDDRLTYALSYASLNSKFGNKLTSVDYILNQVAGSFGYAVNTFETAINVEYDTSDINAFSDSAGTLNKSDAIKTYLTAAYAF
jgi:hypothetical protein